ncbi:CGNR zinc finger domain-containing protein [Rhizobium sp. WSM4643]|uniref:ABATE domain-containing protein n=1 Tax=Rhizobium sp. WSM4643 TaxID=3138253 RepID=UPI0021A31A95|nr:ABATE domain-containing protein [Rhizobium leguminosarum]UWM74495.1 CGNR zinc finger domain-containing protein [Rhizobium leguminosarum bv. viciae]
MKNKWPDLVRLLKLIPRRAETSLKEAVILREAIYTLFLSEDARQPYPDLASEIVHDIAKRARARQVLSKTEDGFRWLLPLKDPGDLVALFAVSASDLITGRNGRRLIRECKGDNCGWLFLVTSKSGRRLWCFRGHLRYARTRKAVLNEASIEMRKSFAAALDEIRTTGFTASLSKMLKVGLVV